MSELYDNLVLEDRIENRAIIECQVPVGVNCRFVKNSQEFRSLLIGGDRARNYFLDDQVPDLGGKLEFQFTAHYRFLRGHDSDGKIFYIGSDVNEATRLFCEENDIVIVNRKEMRKAFLDNY